MMYYTEFVVRYSRGRGSATAEDCRVAWQREMRHRIPDGLREYVPQTTEYAAHRAGALNTRRLAKILDSHRD